MKTRKIVITLIGLVAVLSMLVFGTGAASASAAELCTHSYEETVYIATCTEQGYTEYVCSECGDVYKDNFVEPHGHTYTEIEVPATCTEQGFTTHYCVDCGYQYADNYVAATGHSYSEAVFEPTCTEYGYTMHTCTTCKMSYKDNIVERLGHDYAEEVNEATCLDGGYTTFTCNRCDDTYVGNEVEAKGHTYEDKQIGSTCTAYGFTEHTCIDCDDRYVDNYVKPAGHTYKDVVVPATDTQLGYTKHTCETCSYTYLSDFSESKDDGYVEVPEVEQPPVHEHSYTAEATVNRLERNVVVNVNCDCGENGANVVSVVFVDGNGESTTINPVDGIADYSALAKGTYEVTIVDGEGSILKMFILTEEGEVIEPEQPDIPEIPDEPTIPDEPIEGEHQHNYMLYTVLNEADKVYTMYFTCECESKNVDGLSVVFADINGSATRLTPDADGNVNYAELDAGNYIVQVEDANGEIVNIFDMTIAGEEVVNPDEPVVEPDEPTEPTEPDEPEQPDDNNEDEKEEGSSLGLILGTIIFLLVVAGGIVAVIILKKKDKNKKN